MVKQELRRVELPTTLAEASDLEEFVGYNLKRAYVVIRNDFRDVMGARGLGSRTFSALSFVVQFPNITQSELARELGIERSGLVAIVDDLEKRGYLKRMTVPNDRRVFALVPTATGIDAYHDALETVREHEARLLDALTENEIKLLNELLSKIRSGGSKK